MYFCLVIAVLAVLVCPAITSAKEMTFSLSGNGGNCQGCEWIAAEGEIVSDTPQTFRDFMEDYGPYRVAVVFHSDGGNLLAGLELGRIIRDMGLWTSVGKTIQHPELGAPHEEEVSGICASACTYAFLGGVERFAEEGELGVHQFYGLEHRAPTQETQAIVGLLLIYLMKMGVDWDILAHSLFTRSEEMYWFSNTDLRELALTTEDMKYSEPWILEPFEEGLVLTATYHANATETAQMTFFCRKSDEKWRLLISQPISELKHPPDWPKLRDRFVKDSTIWFSERPLHIDAGNLEFMGSDGGRSYLSITLPIDLISSAGDEFWYWLNDGKSWRFMVRAVVPEQEWLNILSKNCI